MKGEVVRVSADSGTKPPASMLVTTALGKHLIDDALFFVDSAPWLQAALYGRRLRFQHITRGNWNTVERMFKELKRRTNVFVPHFRHANPETAE